jgi:predicted metal-dependent phosphoesterase TrpH
MTTRPVSVLLLAAGLTAGSVADRAADRPPLRTDGRAVLTADLHVHAFPGDGALPAWELRREAKRRGVDVIGVTNHNQLIAATFPVGGSRETLPLVIPGQEITAPDFHLVAIGVRRVVDWRLPLRQAIDAVHEQGGVAIAAHPVRDSWRVRDDRALRTLDGAEAVHAGFEEHSRGRYELHEFYRSARGLNPVLAAIGSSDFHGIAPIGRCVTYIVVDEISERGVLRAIRRGQTVASDNRGTLVGDPAIVTLVQKAGRITGRTADRDFLRQLSVILVLSSLALLICVK